MAPSQSDRDRATLSCHVVQSMHGRTSEREHHVHLGHFDKRQLEQQHGLGRPSVPSLIGSQFGAQHEAVSHRRDSASSETF